MEQTLGHVAVAQNLRLALASAEEVDTAWLPISPDFERWWEALPLLRSNWSLRAGLKARCAIESERRTSSRPHLYFFHTQVVALLSSGWIRNSPPVLISLDATPLNYDRVGRAYGHSSGNAVAERLKFWLNRRAFHKASLLVAFSDWARRSLIDDYGVASEFIEVIPPGIHLEHWRNRARTYRTDPSRVRLLFVGGDFRRKGGWLLYEAFRKSFADTCELHVVTKSPTAPEGQAVFIHRDLAPNSAELRALYHAADVFVLPTDGDVHSIASIEAMAAGLPVVATDVGAVSEVVRDGETGFLVPPGDERALTRALSEIVGNEALRLDMGERGRQRASERFDAEKNGRRLLSICMSL